MRALYLIRHGHPDFPIGSRICLGQTDTPLGPLGHLQGVLLARHFRDIHVESVYSSTLSRAMETAQHISRAPKRWPMRVYGMGFPLMKSKSVGQTHTMTVPALPACSPCPVVKTSAMPPCALPSV